ncbi:NAD(P)-binding domain-containing protein [Saccharopolyspora sp. TS4A08]|uniref:NAD(P)-binding domain-containing protein n=1 Tax=Saccharopolyspora ipomoeae TaxID=3042027 RepID=A0ABT6PQW9_9PSEU|nr:FAD-dependent oxidoreductase [Saccharopolyspora sp. TS4A08]MDI2030404.1 NAD(P)-binding domain-containing protein [Saccharopolyspora sp. TS4A08]
MTVDDRSGLAGALERANLPSLVPVLFQLTGDDRWLREPYRPTRSRGMDDNDSGGFTPEVAAEIRSAALDAVLAHESGTPAAVPAPTGEALRALLELANGEPASPEYAEMLAEDMGFAPTESKSAAPKDIDAIIIGAGVSGMLAAIKLAEAGVEHVVLEKNPDVGGTWYENAYPGAGVDTPSHLYSYSFEPRPWRTHFGKRDEVWHYLRDVAERHDLRAVTRFGTEVTDAAYDETTATWTVRTADGQELTARVLISATGALNRPKVPDIDGLNSFRGRIFHTADWPSDVDLRGKRVAVVGAGASAMQVVPAIADDVASLAVFQRSPQWIAPNDVYFSEVDDAVHLLMDRVPFYRVWYRARLAWNFNDRVHPTLQVDPDWEHPERSVNAANDGHRRVFTRYIESELDGRPDLIAKALPDYPPFGKRMLLDNGWYRTLRREHVELITEGVAEITPTGLRGSDGTEVTADVIVLATGFHTHRFLWPIDVRGRSGLSLAEVWGPENARAHLGITVPGFPNLFLTCGPGTALGHGGSFITIAECQVRYIVDVLTAMAERNLRSAEVRPEVEAAYTQDHDEAHSRMLWTHPGMTNWYRNAAGRVVSTMPWRIVDYWRMTRRADLDEFLVERDEEVAAR